MDSLKRLGLELVKNRVCIGEGEGRTNRVIFLFFSSVFTSHYVDKCLPLDPFLRKWGKSVIAVWGINRKGAKTNLTLRRTLPHLIIYTPQPLKQVLNKW